MRRQELLKQVKKRIASQGVESGEYVVNKDGKRCFCVLGHMMDLCGVDMEALEKDGPQNHTDVIFLKKKYSNPILAKGFTMRELEQLQLLNDSGPDMAYRLTELNTIIDEMVLEGEAV